MPDKYVPPELFMTYKKVKIYHLYHSGNFNDRYNYWFTTDIHEDDDFSFDVRNVMGMKLEIDSEDIKKMKKIIKAAIDEDRLTFSNFQQGSGGKGG